MPPLRARPLNLGADEYRTFSEGVETTDLIDARAALAASWSGSPFAVTIHGLEQTDR